MSSISEKYDYVLNVNSVSFLFSEAGLDVNTFRLRLNWKRKRESNHVVYVYDI
jgi:hypothetical protein